MTADNEPRTSLPLGPQSEEPIPRRKHWPLWVLGGAIVGLIAGINLADDPRHGFYLGSFVGVIVEALIVVLVNRLPGGAHGGPLVAVAVVAAGLAIGAFGGLVVPMAPNSGDTRTQWIGQGVLLGGLLCVLDRVFVWFCFPYGEGVRAPAASADDPEVAVEQEPAEPDQD